MIINWYGEGCFKVQTGGLTLLTDPFEPSTGLTPARGKNEVVLRTLTPWPLKDEEAEGRLIRGAGEYEVREIEIRGFPLKEESTRNLPAGRQEFLNTVYKVTAEEISLGFLGHLAGENLPQEAMEALRDTNIIFMPAAGKPFLNPEAAAKMIKQLNPKFAVASFFKTPGLKRTCADWKELAEEMGQKPEVLEKFTIRKKEVAEQKGTKLIVLKI